MKQGFIVDAPKALILTSKGDSAVLSATSGEISFGGDSITINGGWSAYDLIEIDTTSSIEVALTEAEWKMSNMQLTTGGTVVTGSADQYYFGDAYIVATDEITIPYEVVTGSVRIAGLTEVETTLATTNFKVVVGTGSTVITFFASEFVAGSEISPSFKVAVTASETLTVTTQDAPTSGEVVLQFPVYGDENGVDIEGYLQILVFKAKIGRANKVGGAYKSASTFDITLRGNDPRRADKKMFEVSYIPVAVV